MAVIHLADTPLSETGLAPALLPGLTAALLHFRLEHGDPGASVSGKRQVMAYALAELTHNWPAIVSGENRFHTADMIASDIAVFLATDFGPEQRYDSALRAKLTEVRHELRTGRKRL